MRLVRVLERSRREGVVISRTDSSIFVRDASGEGSTLAILDSLRELAIGVPRSAGVGAARGSSIGLGAGAALTAVAATLVWLSDADENCVDCWLNATGATVILGGIGTVVLTLGGALVGASAPGWRWEPVTTAFRVSTDRPRLMIGVRLALP